MEKNKYNLAQTIDRLAKTVNDREREGADMNAVSWGYEEGVLISANEAKALVEAISSLQNLDKHLQKECASLMEKEAVDFARWVKWTTGFEREIEVDYDYIRKQYAKFLELERK